MTEDDSRESYRARKAFLWAVAGLAVLLLAIEIGVQQSLDAEFYAGQLTERIEGMEQIHFDQVTTSALGRSIDASGIELIRGAGDTLQVGSVLLRGLDLSELFKGDVRPERISVHGIRWRGGAYVGELGEADVDLDEGSVRMGHILYRPAAPDSVFFAPGRATAYEISAGSVTSAGIDVASLLAGEGVRVERISIDEFSADVRAQLRYGGAPEAKTMPNALVAGLGSVVRVDSLEVVGRASYRERPEGVSKYGMIEFADASLRSGPIYSDEPGRRTRIDVYARINGEIPLSARFDWRVAARPLDLNAEGAASSFAAPVLNSMFIPVAGVNIHGGSVDTVRFFYALTDTSSVGWFGATYDGLNVEAVEKNDPDDTRMLVDLILEGKIRSSHAAGDESPPHGDIRYQVQPTDSFFGLLWFSLRSGMKSLVIR